MACGKCACRGRSFAPGSPRSLSGLAIEILQATDIRGAAGILRISWDEAWHLLERAVERGRRAKPGRVTPDIGIDEEAIAKGHQYVTLVCDFDRASVEFIAEDRKQLSLDGDFTALSDEQRAASRRSPGATAGARFRIPRFLVIVPENDRAGRPTKSMRLGRHYAQCRPRRTDGGER